MGFCQHQASVEQLGQGEGGSTTAGAEATAVAVAVGVMATGLPASGVEVEATGVVGGVGPPHDKASSSRGRETRLMRKPYSTGGCARHYKQHFNKPLLNY